MNRIILLNRAIDKVMNTQEYGTPENNFATIANFWTLYLSEKYDIGLHLTVADVALMMDLVKTARLIKTPDHLDSWVDKAGYSACGAEVSDA